MKESKVQVTSKLHEDGAISHKMTFANGQTRLILIRPDHTLAQRFLADGVKKGLLSRINSAKDSDDAVRKVDELEAKWDAGEWALQAEEKEVRVPDLVKAVAAYKNISIEDAKAAVDKLTKAQQAKVRAIPEIATLLATYKADKGSEGDSLLGDALSPGEARRMPHEDAA